MDYKTFCENAATDGGIKVTVTIMVNDELAFTADSFDIDGAIGELGRAERHGFIDKELKRQYEELPERTTEDE